MHLKFLFFPLMIWGMNLQAQYTIMLDPYGDAQHTGRIIEGAFERGVTLQCAEYIKKELNQQFPNTRIVLSRIPGEIVEPLQNASFANKLQVDLYISICFYETEKQPLLVDLYYYKTNPTDDWHSPQGLHWYAIDNLYLAHLSNTKKIAQTFFTQFAQPEYSKFFTSHEPLGIPLLQLKGINCPSLLIEMGLQKKDDWKNIVPAFLQSIHAVLNEK